MTAAGPDTLHIHIDGASRGNPGEAGFGVHVATADGGTVAGLYGYLGRATNNVAEYQALLHALRYALGRGVRRVRVFSDSELVVRQVEGRYKVKHPDMLTLWRQASTQRRAFETAEIKHVRREQNKEADALANRAMDLKDSYLSN